MNTHIANLTNAVVMIVMGAWAYLSSANPSPTSLIPVFIGIVLLMNQYVPFKINALVLVIIGLLNFLNTDQTHMAFINLFWGVLLYFGWQKIKNKRKAQAHVAVVVTLLAFISLVGKPLPSAISKGESLPLFRVALMVITNAVALYYFIQSFIQARKNRAS